MYTASTSDGLHLPPVIFTSDYLPDFDDPKSRYTDKDGNAAYLHYIPNISSPNSQTTIMWLHDMRDERAPMLENGCTLLLDQAGWHKKEEVMQEFEDAEIEVVLLPAKTGKWLDPQDQSFHRELRRKFVALMAQRRGLKLDKILQAYWTMHDKVVTSSWRQTGLLKKHYEEHLRKVAAQGYRAGKGWEKYFSDSRAAFKSWTLKNFGARGRELPGFRVPHAEVSPLDGAARRGWKR